MNFIRKDSKECGFTLVEMGLALLVFSIVVSGLLSLLNIISSSQNKKTTQSNIAVIEHALKNYLVRNNRKYPCPAQGNLAVDAPNFGEERCAALCSTPGSVCIGVVPVRALQLADNYMFDAYGNRITYAVTQAVTTDGNANGIIRVEHDGAATPTTGVKYIVLSHGEDGSGAWTHAGKAHWNSNCASQAVQGKDYKNCDGNNTVFARTFQTSNAGTANQYDDFLSWGKASTVEDNECVTMELAACPAGWTQEGASFPGVGKPIVHSHTNTTHSMTGAGTIQTQIGWENVDFVICCRSLN